jgi:hypothetical protein
MPVADMDEGMTLRDHFAGQAIGGLLAGTLADGSVLSDKSAGVFARMAFDIADAMLEERMKGL